jgi:phosphoglycerol transferase MdoB-like AlkP superfamily enzyme
MLYFAIGRGIFLLFYRHLTATIPCGEILSVFPHAFVLDTATACYLLLIVAVLLNLQLFFESKVMAWIHFGYICIVLIITSIIFFAELHLYGEWLCKLNYKALVYLRHPSEILRTATIFQILLSVVGILLLSAAFAFLYYRLIFRQTLKKRFSKKWQFPVCLIVSAGIYFVGMRGGVQSIPITQSNAYFSQHDILNATAVNPYWNIAFNVADFGNVEKKKKNYHFFKEQDCEKYFLQLFDNQQDTTLKVLTKKKINIVFILLESWTADLIETLSGTSPDITPNFHALEKEGLLFTRYYTNGHRSQQSICSILSGFPPVPDYDITDNHSKYKHLPSLVKILKNNGLYTSFYFGGNLDYGNLRAFLLYENFDKITEQKDIEHLFPSGKLGIHDQYMFDYFLQSLNQQNQPFMSILFTVSSHSPYDQPKNTSSVNIQCSQTPFLNSAHYTDHWLGDFFQKAKQTAWYENTLFIILADHGHPSHLETEFYSADYQHIPMLWVGNVLSPEYRGKTYSKVGSHVDLALTILQQLRVQTTDFQWGKNLLNPYSKDFAYFELNHGFGFITEQSTLIYRTDNHKNKITFIGNDLHQQQTLSVSKAYTQKLFEKYLEY